MHLLSFGIEEEPKFQTFSVQILLHVSLTDVDVLCFPFLRAESTQIICFGARLLEYLLF